MRDTAESAAAHAARWRKFRRGSFIFEPPSTSFDQLVGTTGERQRHREAECFGGLEVDDQLNFGDLLHRQVGRLLPSRHGGKRRRSIQLLHRCDGPPRPDVVQGRVRANRTLSRHRRMAESDPNQTSDVRSHSSISGVTLHRHAPQSPQNSPMPLIGVSFRRRNRGGGSRTDSHRCRSCPRRAATRGQRRS